MATETSSSPSFSRKRKWGIGFNVALLIALALAIVVMLNYLGNRYYHRFYVSTNTRIELAPRTISVLKSLTNDIHVTIYYDKDDSLYSDISDLLKEYHAQNPKIKVTTVDYYRDPAAAQEMKLKYNLGPSTNRNFIIFDDSGRTRIIPANLLAAYDFPLAAEQPDPSRPTYDKKLTHFSGEMLFTPALFSVSNPKSLKVCFLEGHGEKSFGAVDDDAEAFDKLVGILRQNSITNETLLLVGTNPVPADCDLLVIAAPRDKISEPDLEKIEHYLNRGGRLFVLFNAYSADRNTGLEILLAKWGVDVTHRIVKEPENTLKGPDVILLGRLNAFAAHPITRPFFGSALHVVLPRWISRIEPPARAADVPLVTELALSSPKSFLADSPATTVRAYSLMVAVEKHVPKGVATEHGTTRMLIAGDSLFLANEMIESAANRDFANAAVNWLLERTVLLEGLGPRRVSEYRLVMTRGQMQAAQWILLCGMPGGILLLGGLVWFRRRK